MHNDYIVKVDDVSDSAPINLENCIPCDFCKNTFKNREGLSSHECREISVTRKEYLEGTKSFQCDNCEILLKDVRTVKRHHEMCICKPSEN